MLNDSHTADTSPEAVKRVQRVAPAFQQAHRIVIDRAATPPPFLSSPLRTGADATPSSPPFDPAFELAAARPTATRLSAFAAGESASTLGTPISARLPSMRFEDLSVFFRDLEHKLVEKAANTEILQASPAIALPATAPLRLSKSTSSATRSVRNVKAVASAPSFSSISTQSSSNSIPYLTISGPDAPPKQRKPKRGSRISAARSSLPYDFPESLSGMSLADALVRSERPISMSKKQRGDVPPLPIVGGRSVSAPNSPNPEGQFAVFSPRLDGQPIAQFGAALPAPLIVNIQPPTPVLAGSEFEAPAGGKRLGRAKTCQTQQVNRTPVRRSSRIPVAKSHVRSATAGSTDSQDSARTPPLSPSSSNGMSSPDTSGLPRSDSASSSVASDETDGEEQLFNLMRTLQRPPSLPPMPASISKPHNLKDVDEATRQLTDLNLRIHTRSALSALRDSTGAPYRRSSRTPKDSVRIRELDEEINSSSESDRFEDAPSICNSPKCGPKIVRVTPGQHPTATAQRFGGAVSEEEMDIGEAPLAVSSSPVSPRINSNLPWSSARLAKRQQRRKLAESLSDLDGAVVMMSDRVKVGMAM